MRRGNLLWLTLLLCVAGAAFGRPWTVEDDVIEGIPDGQSVNVRHEVISQGHLRLHFNNMAVTRESVELNGKSWEYFSIKGESRPYAIGKPVVPVIPRAVRLPDLGNVELRILSADYEDYENIDVIPQQDIPEFAPNGYKEREFIQNDATYASNEWYPNTTAIMSSPALCRDARTAVLQVHPVQVNPLTRTVRIYRSIDLEILPIGGTGENEMTHPVGAVPSFEKFYSEIIGAEDLEADARRAPPGRILVIARNDVSVMNTMRQWMDWKKLSGRPCQLLTYATATSVANSTLQSAIQAEYDAVSASPLEFVVIVGDDGASGAYSFPKAQGGFGDTDHMYSRLAGNDILGDISVGRFTASSINDVNLIVNRVVNYERNPLMSDTTWFRRGWGYAGTSNQIASNIPLLRYCIAMMNQHGVTNTFYDEHSGGVNASLIAQRLSPGAVNWAHRAGWVGQINPSDVSGIQNINKCFVAFNISCSTGNWGGSGATGLHEALVTLGTPAAPRGAVAAVATSTSSTHVPWNNVMAGGIYYGYGPLGLHQPGPMTWQGKFQLWRNFQTDMASQVTNFSEWNNLMGDPTTYLWSNVPRFMTAQLPNSIGTGVNSLDVNVRAAAQPVADVLVVAWKKNAAGQDETYARVWTDSLGRATLPLSNVTPGQLFICLSGELNENWLPLLDTIDVVQTNGDLALGPISIDDDNGGGSVGNSNGFANPGETIDCNVMLFNRSTVAVNGITGTLVSTDPRVVVSNATQTWRNLAGTDSAAGNGSFRLQLNSGLAHNEVVNLQLRLTATDTTQNRVLMVPITTQSIDVSHISAAFYNTSGQTISLTPGITANVGVTVRNNGGIAVNNSSAFIFSRSPFVSINRAEVSFGALPLGSNVSNPAAERFTISTNALTIRGAVATLGVAFADGAHRDTIFFDVTIGTRTTTDPTGPDAFGYLAYDNTDTSYDIHPTYNWNEIVTNGLGTRLALNDGAETQDVSVVRPIPFPVQYYGRTFDTLTICSNGWAAFGGYQYGNNYYNNFRNWRLPANEGPRNMLAVFWDDLVTTGGTNGVYTYNDTTNHMFVITWKVNTLWNSGANECQILILNEQYWPTFTNDAMVIFQYRQFNNRESDPGGDVHYATIGIADHDYLRGIEYGFWNRWSPGAASIPTAGGRAILFTTAQRFITGTLTGLVTRVDNGQPVNGAQVFLLNGGYSALTDSTGHYTINEVLVGDYQVRASAQGFNPNIRPVTILEDSTSVLNFQMTSPGFTFSPDSISDDLDVNGQVRQHRIVLRNPGNGEMTWNSRLLYGGLSSMGSETESPRGPVNPNSAIDETDDPWDIVYEIPVTQLTADRGMHGIEYTGSSFFVTGSNGIDNPNHVYQFSNTGTLLRTMNQPTVTDYGWRDLAFDGRYMYASEASTIDKFDTTTMQIVQQYPSQWSPARAMAIDTAGGKLYFCDQSTQITVMRLSDGVVERLIPGASLTFGLAWNPADTEYPLYTFTRDSLSQHGAKIIKINPVTRDRALVHNFGNQFDALGCAITNRWNPMLWTFMGLVDSAGIDKIKVFEISFNSLWVQYTPSSGVVAPGDSTQITVTLNSNNMPIGAYRVAIELLTNATPARVTIPVTMNVVVSEAPEVVESEIPAVYSLQQNHPNPFNPSTTIAFNLPVRAPVTLTVHNALGQEVARVVNGEMMAAGSHEVRFNGTALATGVYFYRIKAGNFTATKKMLLVK